LAPGRSRRRLLWNLRASDLVDPRYRRIIGWTARFSHAPELIIANSEAGVRAHIGFGYRPRRIEVVPNGIDVDRFRPEPALRARLRANFGIPPEQVVVAHVARVDPMKDHQGFLAAIAAVPHVTAFLVGDGTERLPLPGNVRALGRRMDIDRLYPVADIVVSSSAFGEGFSNVVAEGMSAGLVPIATDVGDSRLIVGDTGRIVPPRDPALLATAIEAEAALPHEARAARGLAARRRIVERYTIERAVAAYADIYLAGVEPAGVAA
jgi:glycosyltransferase involved in cell wall biosynthesis